MTAWRRRLFVAALLACFGVWTEASALPPNDYPPGGGKENVITSYSIHYTKLYET